MKILVTGVAGFIGMHVAERLLARGDEVFGLDSINDYYDISLKKARLARLEGNPRFRFVVLDVANTHGVSSVFDKERFDLTVHLAAQAGVRYSLINPDIYIQSNLVGFLNILEGCRHTKVKHLVYASSSSVYGGNEKIPFSESDNVDHPVSLYAATKKSNELMAHTYSHLFDLPTTGLRFFTVYGPWGRPDMALSLFVKAMLEGRPIDVFNHGNMVRDFTFIDDIVESIVRAIDRPATPSESYDPRMPDPSISNAPYRLFNIGNNRPIFLTDYIEMIEHALGVKAVKNFLPLQAGDVQVTNADTTALMDWIGYVPLTNVRDGVSRFVKWYRAHYNI
jgi:UDP-glucuronate 4-epimerase